MGGLMLWPLALLSPWLLIIPCVLLIQSPLIYRFSQKLAKRFQLEWETEMGRMGDYEVWPFLRRADFVAAKEKSGFSPGHWPEELGQYG
jgi:hypothetical protein